jgi:quercetin dioxygenase-like cupin family protein
MRLSGVKYRRIEASAPFGVAFHQAPGKAQFHFVSHGSALLRMESGTTFTLSGGDALFIPTATLMPCSLTNMPTSRR